MRAFLPLALLPIVAMLGSEPANATNVPTYPNEPYYTAGVLEGFRTLVVEPEAFAKTLAPVEPLPGAQGRLKADLHIPNDSIGWINVFVNGTEVGKITPMVTGIIHDVPAGGYDVTYLMANGFKTTYRLVAAPPSVERFEEEPPATISGAQSAEVEADVRTEND